MIIWKLMWLSFMENWCICIIWKVLFTISNSWILSIFWQIYFLGIHLYIHFHRYFQNLNLGKMNLTFHLLSFLFPMNVSFICLYCNIPNIICGTKLNHARFKTFASILYDYFCVHFLYVRNEFCKIFSKFWIYCLTMIM